MVDIIGGIKVILAKFHISDGEDVDNSAQGNDKVLVYKTATSKHVYEAMGAATDHGALLGLADDDHPQYTKDAEVDTIVATHAAIASAHHAKYTDAEVDAIVAVHAAIASAHHAKYTDAEVDAIVLTHKNIAGAHHTKTASGDIDIHLAKDVEDAAIGDDKVLVYKTGSSKHVYEAKPTGGGTVGRGFRAWRNTNQSIPNITATVVVHNVEYFDTDNCYNTANGKFTPTTAGYYSVHANTVLGALNDGIKFVAGIKKNGVYQAVDRGVSGGVDFCGACVSCVVYMNGTTDYLESCIYHNHGSARNTNLTEGYCTFSAWLLPAPT